MFDKLIIEVLICEFSRPSGGAAAAMQESESTVSTPGTVPVATHLPPRPRFPWITFTLGLLLLVTAAALWWAQAGIRPINVLVMGTDSDGMRTDVVVAVRWEPATQTISLVSLPRDLRLDIPCRGISGCKTPDKLAHAHAYGLLDGAPGGPELTVKAVETLMGVSFPNFVRFDFKAFARLVDALGGVTLQVDTPMDYEDPYQNLSIHIKTGRQKMDGETALKYVRFRDDGRGDIGRIERTQNFFHALLESSRQSGAIARLPAIVQQVWPHVKTDINLTAAMGLARAGSNVKAARIQTTSVPGEAKWMDDLWFWEADPNTIREIATTYLGRKL